MKKDGTGGDTTLTGLYFEERVDLRKVIGQIPGYSVFGNEISFQGKKVAILYKKYELYKKLLKPNKVDWSKILSKRLLPDETLLNLSKKTLFVIEIKYQQVAGSVDEKLQTCDFKKKQYRKLLAPLGITVEYVYLLNDWFRNSSYQDTLDYIEEMNCHYFFYTLPLDFLGLPKPAEGFSDMESAK